MNLSARTLRCAVACLLLVLRPAAGAESSDGKSLLGGVARDNVDDGHGLARVLP